MNHFDYHQSHACIEGKNYAYYFGAMNLNSKRRPKLLKCPYCGEKFKMKKNPSMKITWTKISDPEKW